MHIHNALLSKVVIASSLVTSAASAAEQATSGGNLLTNPSFEQPATPTDEGSLPGWVLDFRRSPDQPPLSADEVAVIDDPKQAHSGRRFLRIQSRSRDLALRSPQPKSYEPGLYEVSAWVRGRPGTIAALNLDRLGANFGAGIQGVNETWQKFSLVTYSPGVTDIPHPELAQLFLCVFAPGQRGQPAEPQLDVDDVSVTLLTSGLGDAFGDHMVVQRDRPVPLRGWAKDPGQKVTVEFNGQTKSVVADKEGRWQTTLEPMKAGGPYVLKLDGRPTAYDLMVGDVWICSGQSNMEFGVDLLNGYFNHAPEALAEANYPQIRLWQAPKQFSAEPAKTYFTHQSGYPADFQARWEICSPVTVGRGIWGGFSAVGYAFGRDIQADQQVAIGLVMIANGGTEIESFISEEGLRPIPPEQRLVPPLVKAATDHLKNTPPPSLPADFVAPSVAYGEQVAGHLQQNSRAGGPDREAFHYASAVYNSLVAPAFPMAVRGVLWYQGEHNGNDPNYEAKLKALIADWRARLGQKDLPFVIAQLCNWRSPDPARWPLVREAQLRVSQSVPNVALVVTIDLADKEGDGYGVGEIHPKQKFAVGQRMALAARAVAYGEKLVSSGPIYRALKVDKSAARLDFNSVGGGLIAQGGKLTGFQIAGSDKKFVDAEAVIEGQSVVVSSPAVGAPVAVRYAFAQAVLPTPNLYNKEGLPASPFRTDDWPSD